jgi:hypothetical protein
MTAHGHGTTRCMAQRPTARAHSEAQANATLEHCVAPTDV